MCIYTYVYVYTCIILHQEERGECPSIESPSAVVPINASPPRVSRSVVLSPLSLSRWFWSSRLRAIFFSHLVWSVKARQGACSLDAKGELIISLMPGVEEYPIQWSRLGSLLSLTLSLSLFSSLDSRDCIGRETNPLNYPLRVSIDSTQQLVRRSYPP